MFILKILFLSFFSSHTFAAKSDNTISDSSGNDDGDSSSDFDDYSGEVFYLQQNRPWHLIWPAQIRTPSGLYLACKDRNSKLIQELLFKNGNEEHFAEILGDADKSLGATLFYEALKSENERLIIQLLDENVDLSTSIPRLDCYVRYQHNSNSIYHYLFFHCAKNIRTLVLAHPKVLARDRAAEYALHYAVQIEDLELVKELLDRGADPHVKINNSSPIELSKPFGPSAITDELKKHIRDLPAFYGVTPWHSSQKVVEKPGVTGLATLDNKLDDVELYLNIITEYRKNKTLSHQSKQLLNDKLETAVELFRERIEAGPNFAQVKEFWMHTQLEVQNIKASGLVNIPLLHIVGLKLVLISDLGQVVDEQAREQFLKLQHPRLRLLILNYGDTSNFLTMESLIFMNPIDKFGEIKAGDLIEKIPLFDKDPSFGLSALFYAALNYTAPLAYSPEGSNEAHGGFVRSFNSDAWWGSFQPPQFWSNLSKEEFSSALIFLEHDWMHYGIYRQALWGLDSFEMYLKIFNIALHKSPAPKSCLMNFALITLLFHELGLSRNSLEIGFQKAESNSESKEDTLEKYHCGTELEFIIRTKFCPFENCLPAMEAKFKTSHPHEYEESRKAMAVFQLSDFVSLLKEANVDIALDPERPWMDGPELARVLIDYVKTSEIGRVLLEHSKKI